MRAEETAWSRAAAAGGEGAVLALALYAWDALGHLRWGVTDFLVVLGMWWAGNLGVRWWRARRGGAWWLLVVEWGGPVLGMVLWNGRFKYALTPGQLIYAGCLGAGVVAGWRLLDAWERRREPGVGLTGERLRRLLILAGVVAAVLPFFNDRNMGGTDARWYAYMLADFIAQARAGVWPIFVSQGDLMMAGAVHVFRSAPLFLWQAGLWDVVTWRALNIDALQHLTVVGAMAVAAAGMYGCTRSLLPERRWGAGLITLLYVWAPGVLAVIYMADMYMTMMAVAVAPWVVWANWRVGQRDDWAGQAALGAALALSWMAHPPTAMLLTLATAWVQVLRLIEVPRWTTGVVARAAAGAAVFLAAGAYYFAGMSELPSRPGGSMKEGVKLVVVLVGAMLALGRATRGREWPGWIGVVLAGVWLAQNNVPWAWWWAGVVVVMAGWMALDAGRPGWRLGAWWAEVFLGATLGVAAVAWWGLGGERPEVIKPAWATWAQNHQAGWKFLGPIAPTMNAHAVWTPGLGWWVAGAVALGMTVLGRRRGAGERGWWGPVAVTGVVLLGVPAAGEFLAAYAPEGIAEMVGWPLPLRVVMPLTAMGGILIAGAWGAWPARGAARWVAGGVLLVAAGWAAGELRHVWRRGAAVTATREVSAMQGLSERAVMDRFVYDLLRIPAYFSHGKVDPRLETRLLDEAGQVIIGPDEVARRMEEAGVEEFDLRVRPHAVAGGPWLEFEPRIAVEPGEQVLLAFEFREEDYAGHLILTSRHGRREYILPRSGLGQAFGTEASSSRVISLWNSRAETQEYKGEMVARPEHAAEVRDGVFARVRRSRFDPERAPIRMRSWMPYRAEVEAGEGVAWVETPRAFIPGYKATVDGVEAPVVRSVQHLVKVPVEPGQRLVEVRYAGTTRLWGGLVVSGLTWIGLLGWWGWASRRAGADQSSQG